MSMQLLTGKTIARVIPWRRKKYDDEPFLEIQFTDGTSLMLESTYGGYSGKSYDEYPSYFNITGSAIGSRSVDTSELVKGKF